MAEDQEIYFSINLEDQRPGLHQNSTECAGAQEEVSELINLRSAVLLFGREKEKTKNALLPWSDK